MHCPRCKGFMVPTRLEELGSSNTVNGWRCLLCGGNIDLVVEGIRTNQFEALAVPRSLAAKSARRGFR